MTNVTPETSKISIFTLTALTNKEILKINELRNEMETIICSKKKLNIKKNNFLFEEEESSNGEVKHNTEGKKNSEEYRFLTIKTPIYDSLEEEDLLINDIYVNQSNCFVMVLNIIIMICAIYSLVEIPFFLGNYNFGFNTINTINIIIDLFYIIDCVSQFFLPYYEDDILEKNLKKIIIHYLKSYFFIDFLSAIPLRTIFLISDGGFKKKSIHITSKSIILSFTIIKIIENNQSI